jgi:hypothetical protein
MSVKFVFQLQKKKKFKIKRGKKRQTNVVYIESAFGLIGILCCLLFLCV